MFLYSWYLVSLSNQYRTQIHPSCLIAVLRRVPRCASSAGAASFIRDLSKSGKRDIINAFLMDLHMVGAYQIRWFSEPTLKPSWQQYVKEQMDFLQIEMNLSNIWRLSSYRIVNTLLLGYNKTIQLLWYGEIIAVDSEVHIKLINAIRNHYEELFNVKPAVRLEIITRF
jgi:hypothetical protein